MFTAYNTNIFTCPIVQNYGYLISWGYKAIQKFKKKKKKKKNLQKKKKKQKEKKYKTKLWKYKKKGNW